MSYILDALKKAESERERGTVPGLHSQSTPLRIPAGEARVVAKPLVLAGAALALTLLGVLAWRLSGPVTPATGASMPSSAASPAPTGQTVTAIPVAPVAAVVSAVSVASAAATASAVANTASPEVKPAVPVARPPPAQPEMRPQSVTTVTAAPAPSSNPVVPFNELPADIRQTLPKLVISGSTYSDNRALRMLIINGEVFREGEKPAPDVQLEQIRAKSAVLNFKGLRYAVAY